ncbi:MAG: hypothetical protein PWQ89_1848 [Verrucomicrobiota bacterium]|jgi:hypothetical protein|nr:hypothetical protein [Verrucomicrobiota bacterium]
MNALYISNYRNDKSRNNRRMNPLRKWRNTLRGYEISGQDGFFVASLYNCCNVTERDLAWLKKNLSTVDSNFDTLFINYKSDEKSTGIDREALLFLNRTSIQKILVVTNAKAADLPGDPLLDLFDIVFKREHYVDLDRYPVSSVNKAKIRNTMLGCPLIRTTTRNVHTIRPASLGFTAPSEQFSHDLFFSGKTTSPIRLNAMERLHKEGFNVLGGLNAHKKYDDPIPPALLSPRFSRNGYIQAVRGSKINLALEGYGEYTFRHNEILFLCSFMISTPSIRGLKLPLHLIENKHYVCFEDLDDLVDKVRYYLVNESERQTISRAGRDLFEKEYDLKKHGQYIKQAIQS